MIIELHDQAEALSAMTKECHGRSYRAGWYHDPVTREPLERNVGEMMALIHSEVSEALEGNRKNLKDTHLTDRPMIEVELADVAIRVFDLSGYLKFNLADRYRRRMNLSHGRAVEAAFDLREQGEALNAIVKECYGRSNLYHDPMTREPIKRNVGEMLARIHSDFAKSFDAYLIDGRLPGSLVAAVRITDALVSVFELAGYLNLDLGESYRRKLLYNEQRQDHKLETRAAGGKAF